jgi:hypothetical protein
MVAGGFGQNEGNWGGNEDDDKERIKVRRRMRVDGGGCMGGFQGALQLHQEVLWHNI